jgi:hypothetical protein
MGIRALPALLAAGLMTAAAGCASQSTPTPAAPAAPAATTSASPSPSASPVTADAAKAAATTYFDLYAAHQFTAAYALLSPSSRAEAPESTWVGAHEQCDSQTLAYSVTRPTLAGNTAVVNVSLAGAAASLGSEEASFVYSAGRWWYSAPNLSAYHGHTTAEAVQALKADGVCS